MKHIDRMHKRKEREAEAAAHRGTVNRILGHNPTSDDYKAAMDATGLSMSMVCKLRGLYHGY